MCNWHVWPSKLKKITFNDPSIIIDGFGMTTGKNCTIIKFPL